MIVLKHRAGPVTFLLKKLQGLPSDSRIKYKSPLALKALHNLTLSRLILHYSLSYTLYQKQSGLLTLL